MGMQETTNALTWDVGGGVPSFLLIIKFWGDSGAE